MQPVAAEGAGGRGDGAAALADGRVVVSCGPLPASAHSGTQHRSSRPGLVEPYSVAL